jgi:hypothetical protein
MCPGNRIINRVIEAVAISEHDDFAQLAANLNITEYRHLGRVPVVQIVRRELIVPPQLTGVGIERNDRIAVKIVTETTLAVIVGTRIADTVVEQVELRVECPSHPDARTTSPP